MKTITLLLLTLTTLSLTAQTTINGTVADTKGELLTGANVFLKGTYDGVATNAAGRFELKTNLLGKQVLVVAFMGFTTVEQEIALEGKALELKIVMKPEAQRIADVVISAGSFEASDRSKSVTLQPLDIVTTPSATGDIYGALTALPGAATIGEDGRLFVRGGDGYETKTFIDGLLSKKPYGSSVPDLPSRGRFSPFMFSGTTFSTGGYSAEYGQALSSALILNSIGFHKESQTELSVMTIGTGISQVMKKEKSSLSAGVEYANLKPYMQLAEQRFSMNQYPESVGATAVARQRVGSNGFLKAFSTFSASRFGLSYPTLNVPGEMADISIANQNSYTNLTYSQELANGWFLKSGAAFTFDVNNLDLSAFTIDETNRNFQAKITLKKDFTDRTSLIFGVEETGNSFLQRYKTTENFENNSALDDFGTAAFTEFSFRPLERLAVRAGVRAEHSSLLNDENLAGRLSAAYQVTEHSQFSAAYGNFYQTPEENLLRFTQSLDFERADHYIVNYQWEQDDRVVRAELYHKEYKSLVTYNSSEFWNGTLYQNAGSGYSRGIDIFYRDRKTVKFLEYWLSYSYIESKRLYRDYPQKVTPPFVPSHTASVMGKMWVQKITTQFGMSATVASGRPYNNPNRPNFMDGRTSLYNDISLSISHLTEIFGNGTIVFMSVNNLLGRDNIYGYRYYAQPNANGVYESFPVKAGSKRFYFIGVFITI